jgi:hypothetical protein
MCVSYIFICEDTYEDCRMNDQIPMFDSPADIWHLDTAKRSLVELFILARQYRSGKDFRNLLQFISNFRSYSMFNAVLVHIQMPGARFVAPASRWKRDHHREIRLGAREIDMISGDSSLRMVSSVLINLR